MALNGMAPIRYLKIWRLLTARLQLCETQVTLGCSQHTLGPDDPPGDPPDPRARASPTH